MISFELEKSLISWFLFTTTVVGFGHEHNEDVVLSWEHIFSSELTHTDVSLFERIVGLTLEIVIIEFFWGLHINIDIFIETYLLSFNINISIVWVSIGQSSVQWLFSKSGWDLVFAEPISGGRIWHCLIKVEFFDCFSTRGCEHDILISRIRALVSVSWLQKGSQKSVFDIGTSCTESIISCRTVSNTIVSGRWIEDCSISWSTTSSS